MTTDDTQINKAKAQLRKDLRFGVFSRKSKINTKKSFIRAGLRLFPLSLYPTRNIQSNRGQGALTH